MRDHSRPSLRGALLQKVNQVKGGAGIQHGKRLIQDEHRGAPGSNCCQGEFLLLTAREGLRRTLAQRLQPELNQRLIHLLPDLGCGQTQVFRPKNDLLLHGDASICAEDSGIPTQLLRITSTAASGT